MSVNLLFSHFRMSVKRRFPEANRVLDLKWEEEYLLVKSSNKPQLLACLQVRSVPKKFNLKRFYETRSKSLCGKYEGTSRKAILNHLKMQIHDNKLHKQFHQNKSESILQNFSYTCK